jgi:hypothetical protein
VAASKGGITRGVRLALILVSGEQTMSQRTWIIIAVVVVIVILLFWIWGGSDEAVEAPAGEAPAVEEPATE